jgi:ADP-ribose pyrophosphatase YjhB (NUDIX family)
MVIETHIPEQFIAGVLQIVKVIRVIHMTVAVTFIGAHSQLAFTEHDSNHIMMTIMFQYCPSCGEKNLRVKGNRFDCQDCGFVYFQSTAAATGCIIQAGEKIVMLVRGKDPSCGKLDIPGGFVDPGEGIFEGLLRELREELSWEPPVLSGQNPAEVFKFFASFPNVYLYENIAYNTCDVYFTVSAPGLSEKDLKAEAAEITEIRFLQPGEINPDDLAFSSTRRVIEVFKKTI